MPASRETVKRKAPKSGATDRHDPVVALPERDPKSDVKLAGDWLDRWLPALDELELKVYLSIADHYNERSYHSAKELNLVSRGGAKATLAVIAKLEEHGLLEVVHEGGKLHYHFPHVDSEGFHRAARARPSLREALDFQRRMSEELVELTEQDETPALREKMFRRYPALREEYELWRTSADPDAPAWRLWMEVSRYLIREFEQRFGTLHEDHGEIFRQSAEAVLRHHLDVVDGVTREVVAKLDRLFPHVETTFVIAPREGQFVKSAFVKRLAARYGVGPEQIFANVLEALGSRGTVVVATDETGRFESLLLPTTTGLTKSEERVLFLTPAERDADDGPRQRERVRRARNRYANHLIQAGVATIAGFQRAGKLQDPGAALQRIADKVNEQLSLLEGAVGEEPPVTLENVVALYERVRDGARQG